ncbi:MAG: FAD-binding oxidoreductase [Rhizobiaceae bacterium]|nr:FAD-binding oxidoreductase [Rhizobiaceae bacterium]MCV0406630.1 FAD-binding oxidoreductase [Rhizobiaceae bacterium]
MTGHAYRSFGLARRGRENGLPAPDAVALLEKGAVMPGGLLAYGNGRSYGDSCLNDAGMLADMRGMDRILGFDPATGIIEVEAGVMLWDLVARAAVHGYFPPVLPGTRFVTVGGAIANDVHGKNHHRRGTFGCHVEELVLLRSDGRRLTCSATDNPELFSATIGGMGLTGLILSAKLKLMPVGSAGIVQTVRPFPALDAYLDMAEQADADNEYAVAWIDQLATGRKAGRGLLITGNHAEGGPVQALGANTRLSVPFQPPVTVLGRPFLTIFNEAYFQAKRRQATPRTVGPLGFFFPLDGARHWNRLYGPDGLFQHQSVISFETARTALPALLEATREAGQASFLTVLKRFGRVASPGLLSFPRPGYTLTLDFPNRGRATLDLLARLDRITVDAGGAVNPYKDARMNAATFEASFPHWRRLERLRDPAFLSDFWRRTAMALDDGGAARLAAE